MSTVKIAYDIGRSNKEPIDADYIVSKTISKTGISNYITSLDVAHNGMQLYFENLELGVIITNESTGEYVELGGGGVAIVEDNSKELQLLTNLQTTNSLENGQLIYNQSEDKYKKYFNGSLIESSGQIITDQERSRLQPNVVTIDASNKGVDLIDDTSNSGYWILDWSKTKFLNKSGSIIKFKSNSLGITSSILIDLPIDTLVEGWNIFAIVVNGDTDLEYQSNSTIEPFSSVSAVPGFLTGAYNIGTSTGTEFSVIGNIFDAS